MLKHYYFNKNTDNRGNHEVHVESCEFMPAVLNREYIGYEDNCKNAITRATSKTGKYNFDGCYFCCKPCHKG